MKEREKVLWGPGTGSDGGNGKELLGRRCAGPAGYLASTPSVQVQPCPRGVQACVSVIPLNCPVSRGQKRDPECVGAASQEALDPICSCAILRVELSWVSPRRSQMWEWGGL